MELPIKGMTCQGCAQRIEDAVVRLPHAKNVRVNFALKSVTYEGADSHIVKQTIKELGYEVPEEFSASTFQTSTAEKIAEIESIQARRAFLLAAIFGVPEFLFGM